MKKSFIKTLLAVVIVVNLVFISLSTQSFAYSTPFGTCPNIDCCSAVPGTIISSSFPLANATHHMRSAKCIFICDNCEYHWEEKRMINERHEFVANRCECGYIAH